MRHEERCYRRKTSATATRRPGSTRERTLPRRHTLVAEGVFEEQPDGSQRFVPALAPPIDVEVGRLLASVRRRIVRLVRRHGIDLDGALADEQTTDPMMLVALAEAYHARGQYAEALRQGAPACQMRMTPRRGAVVP